MSASGPLYLLEIVHDVNLFYSTLVYRLMSDCMAMNKTRTLRICICKWFITFSAVKTLSQPIFNFMLELHILFFLSVLILSLSVRRWSFSYENYSYFECLRQYYLSHRRLHFHILPSHLFKQSVVMLWVVGTQSPRYISKHTINNDNKIGSALHLN